MKDLTKGKPSSLILSFAFPIFLANLLQLTYSLADTRIVGSFLGEDALAAVGSTSTVSNLIIGFLLGVVLWAIAQYMINVNNTILISKSCEKNNIALVSAVFPIISGSGTVLGPLLGGIIVNTGSVHIIWLFNMILVMIGTVLLYILEHFFKRGSSDSTSKT